MPATYSNITLSYGIILVCWGWTLSPCKNESGKKGKAGERRKGSKLGGGAAAN